MVYTFKSPKLLVESEMQNNIMKEPKSPEKVIGWAWIWLSGREGRGSVCVCVCVCVYSFIYLFQAVSTVKNVLFLFGEEKVGLNNKMKWEGSPSTSPVVPREWENE